MDAKDLAPNPFQQFRAWLGEAEQAGLREPTAMALATVGATGTPSVRMVLLRGWDDEGFRFFTNYESQKGLDLEANPMASLLFYWDPLQQQVRIDGEVARLDGYESDAYFATRPRESQLGAKCYVALRNTFGRASCQWVTRARRVPTAGQRYPTSANAIWGYTKILP